MIELLIFAVALSMDAFAVSLGLGARHGKTHSRLALKAGVSFGIFHALMPLIGYLAGVGLSSMIGAVDHWVAFALLLIIGAKMIYESLTEPVEENIAHLTNRVMLILVIATSIDAMAAGFTLTLIKVPVPVSIVIIGMTTFLFSYVGVRMGAKSGTFLEQKAEIAGGVVLILIGLKILVEHTLLKT